MNSINGSCDLAVEHKQRQSVITTYNEGLDEHVLHHPNFDDEGSFGIENADKK